jgi:predicted DNA-binding transcriptional regulator YafY
LAAYPRTGRSPEALVKILVTMIEKTPSGGASLEDIREAYLDAKDVMPTDRTIYRNIRRINELLSPAGYASKQAKGKNKSQSGDQKEGSIALPLAIRSIRDGTGKMRYSYSGRSAISKGESSQALLIVLGLYSQQKGILKDHFEKVIGSMLQDVVAGKDGDHSFFSDIEENIHVSGHGPAEPKKLLRRISEIIRAIENCKLVKIDYIRVYDGVKKTREVEPYGLICRHGSWYLVGRCRRQEKRRIYLLDHVKHLEVVENSTFKRPAGLNISGIFKDAWGIWNVDDDQAAKIETVRLKAKKGVAERFRAVSFHGSQKVTPLPDGEAEVTFKVYGAAEMIPWLMSWGPTVEVIEPQWLREELLKNLRITVDAYLQQ